MSEGLAIWKKYFKTDFEVIVIKELKLERTDVGWYQVRAALKKHEGDDVFMSSFNYVYTQLANKLAPMVYKYGFLVE